MIMNQWQKKFKIKLAWNYFNLNFISTYNIVITISGINEDDVNCGNTNWNEDMIVTVVIAIKAIAN